MCSGESIQVTTKEIPFLLGHCPSWPLHYEARTFLLGLLPAFFSGPQRRPVWNGGPFSSQPRHNGIIFPPQNVNARQKSGKEQQLFPSPVNKYKLMPWKNLKLFVYITLKECKQIHLKSSGKCWVTGFKLHKKAWMGVHCTVWDLKRVHTAHLLYLHTVQISTQVSEIYYSVSILYSTNLQFNPMKEHFLTAFMETLPRKSEPNSFSPPDTLWIWKAGWESVVQHQKVQGDLWWNLICKSIQFATRC